MHLNLILCWLGTTRLGGSVKTSILQYETQLESGLAAYLNPKDSVV